MRLSLRIREAAARAGSGTVLIFCDEAQRYNENEYEWLRDVHDALDRQQIKRFTFLVGQQELLAQKTALQVAGKTQIVARLMVEELPFYGIRNAEDVATCLNGYDQTAYPEGSGWSFTRFYTPQAFDAGYRLVSDADARCGARSRQHTTRRIYRASWKSRWNRSRASSRSCARRARSGMHRATARSLPCGPSRCSTAATFSLAMPPVGFSSPQHSTALLQAPRFPILSLDERKLTPALGYVFHRKWLDPCESLVSILWKFEKANAVPGRMLARLMGPDIDPYEGVVPELGLIDLERLRDSLSVPTKTLRTALLRPTQRRRYSNVFRHCRSCMAHGYHSVLHQIENLHTCPAHHRTLETACRRCGYDAPYRLSVQLLEAPYRCAYCRASYGGHGWTPCEARPMKAQYHKAIMRRYFELYFG